MHRISPHEKRFTPELIATWIIVFAYVVWLLSLSVWPSQDGPVHLYYTHVLGALLSHSDPVYARYFSIKHVLPPYALYYYGMLALSWACPLLVADRLMICAYVVSFVFGFRYMARALGPAADTVTLLVTALVLNWTLGMGFVNFCLSLSFAFWAIGLWLRFADQPQRTRGDIWRRVAFVMLAIAITLTHPVPLALVVFVCFVFLVVGRLRKEAPEAFIRNLVTLAAASLMLVYVKLFTTSHPLEQIEPAHGRILTEMVHRAARYAREDGVILLFGHARAIQVYRVAIGLLLIIPLAAAIWQLRKNRGARVWTNADTLLCLGVLLLVLLPLIPSQINGLFYFADRLPLLVWLTLLLAASGAVSLRANRLARGGLMALALIANVSLLYASNMVLRPIADTIAAVEKTPVRLRGQLGFIVEDPRPPASVQNEPSWNPFYWAAIHVVRHNDAILANAPWMNETILPVGATPALPESRIPALRTPQPTHVYEAFKESPDDLAATLQAVSFFVVNEGGRESDIATASTLFATAPESESWRCSLPAPGWYALCEKTSGSAATAR